MMKKLLVLFLVLSLCLSLCACGTKTLSGTYTNESGKQTLEFKTDGTFKYTADVLGISASINGTYSYNESDSTFTAKLDSAVLGSLEHTIKLIDKSTIDFEGQTFVKK